MAEADQAGNPGGRVGFAWLRGAFSMERIAAAERGRLALWSPVALGVGVWAYFALAVEPPAEARLLALGAALLAVALRSRVGGSARAAFAAFALIAIGFAGAQTRALSVAAPVWSGDARSAAELTGRIEAIDVSRSSAPRLTLAAVRIDGATAQATPTRIRVSLFDAAADRSADLRLGDYVRLAARLSPPPGPAEPGAFDFRRKAWFDGLGALGVARSGLERVEGPPPTGLEAALLTLNQLRADIAARARAAIPGQTGAVIAALLVGDRSGLSPETVQALRDANLAHLLAISGLHMGLICLTAFGLVRLSLAAHPATATALPAKKIAAGAALIVGLAYLALSGATVPTQRAFLMAAVAFGAVLIDRPAVTLRAVAVAATAILLWRPESLFDAGFQLSFAATTAMVAFFEATRPIWIDLRRRPSFRRRALAAIGALTASSAIAGFATAPFAAFLFNRLSRYGLLANLAAVPLMGALVMPAGLAALVLMPLGWEKPALLAMALGVDWILGVAHFVADLPGAAMLIKAGPNEAMALIALGGLFLCLTRSAALRFVAVAPILLGAALWAAETRPDLLIAREGRLIGLAATQGRALDRARGAGFAAELWLRRDGDPAPQADANARWPGEIRRGERAASAPSGWRVRVWLQRTPYDGALRRRCGAREILVLPLARVSDARRERLGLDCVLFDRDDLRAGAVAARWRDGAPVWRRAENLAGRRLWTAPGEAPQ